MPVERRRHILLQGTGRAEPYKPRPSRGPTRRLPARLRDAHAARLSDDLDRAWRVARERRQAPEAVGVSEHRGVVLEFQSAATFDLVFEKLERRPARTELLAVRTVGDVTTATVLVPEGQVAHFVRLIEDYRTREAPKGAPRNRELIESIAGIRLAVLESFWTDEPDLFPRAGDAIWWEVWLRRQPGEDNAAKFTDVSAQLGISVDQRRIDFPERTVLLARGTPAQLGGSLDLLDIIAELRLARPTAAPIMRMTGPEQQQIIADVLARLTPPEDGAPAVCLLDTGVTHAHPLLARALRDSDLQAVDPLWGTHDHHGHGTEMAGLALYGDLVEVVSTSEPIALRTCLESVKLLPPHGQNPPELYGALTAQAVARAEIQAPQRARAVCLTATVSTYRDRGQPTSWSAGIDAMCSGAGDGVRRLVLAAAGNAPRDSADPYPDGILVESIHDPGQSWNAITVGACTDKVRLDDADFAGWTPIAPHGDLSPSTTTSTMWQPGWPSKPDIVFEGGNLARSPDGRLVDAPDALGLLTTSFQPLARPLIVSGDTSAATAQASRLAALIYSAYPDLWPETVRALLVHSAEWSPATVNRFASGMTKRQLDTLLRCCGFGVPDIGVALWSATNALTLLVQDELQPFNQDRMNEMHLHALPWPRDVLESLGDTRVELRVTLSYFVEPNPGRRGWAQKFRYMSHGLRFAVNTPEQGVDEFRARMNRAARDEEDHRTPAASDADEWALGPRLRNRGSIHSDRWHGDAVRLAARGYVGVYPVTGWWRERKHLGRSNRRARYALVVTLRTPEEDVDIYTPVLNQVAVAAHF